MTNRLSTTYQDIPIKRFMQTSFRRQAQPRACWAACLGMQVWWIVEALLHRGSFVNLYGGWREMRHADFTRAAASMACRGRR